MGRMGLKTCVGHPWEPQLIYLEITFDTGNRIHSDAFGWCRKPGKQRSLASPARCPARLPASLLAVPLAWQQAVHAGLLTGLVVLHACLQAAHACPHARYAVLHAWLQAVHECM